MTVEFVSAESTDLFVGTASEPRQVLAVMLTRTAGVGPLTVSVAGPGVHGSASVPLGDGPVRVEVPLDVAAAAGERVPVGVGIADERGERLAAGEASVLVEEPGWTMYLVSHFHYDPVWWNTQAAYTSPWELLSADATTRPLWERNGFALVEAHLDLALRDPDYAFVLAEIDYLKPYFDTHPHRRAELRQLLAEGRVELLGGTYNEPNTNLTSAETTIRNIVYGIGYQRDILGGDPRTAWQLDAFGHDPQFPGLLAAAGLTGSAWARGPFHQWGPILKNFGPAHADARVMQFPSEFEWIAPSGHGVLTHYMPNHYSAGWWMDSAATLADAEGAVYALYRALKPVAATRNVLLPVGTDYAPPNKWVTEIHRSWAARYVWPRFVCGIPRDFLDAVRTELAQRGARPSPQTRDMNPVYTGKDVSYIDTKQAQRAAEVAALDAERLATVAALYGLGSYPDAAMDKVWRHLAYGAHHDAITGSESDQVYIDLVAGWREAHDLAATVRDTALEALASRIDATGDGQAIVVTNTLPFGRSGLVSVPFDGPTGPFTLLDDTGSAVPCRLADGALTFRAADVPALGWRTWWLRTEAVEGGWFAATGDWMSNPRTDAEGPWVIESERWRVTADPARGGGLSSIYDKASGRELLQPGTVANELRVYEEYPTHPQFGEGPWHLLPKGPVVGSAGAAADVRAERGVLGSRLMVSGSVDGIGYEQTVTLFAGDDTIDFRTRVLDYAGADRLLRVKFPCALPGALPVSEVAAAVVGRGFALPDVDAGEAPWTLDNPANNWFGLSSTARIELVDPSGDPAGSRALGVAEVVVPDALADNVPDALAGNVPGALAGNVPDALADNVPGALAGNVPDADRAADARELVVALARVGVTATTSTAAGSRYGWLSVDSNLPDFRIILGGPDENPLAAELLERADPVFGAELDRQLGEDGAARVWVPAERPLTEVWQPNADLRDVRALPALIVAAGPSGDGAGNLAAAVAALAADVADARITAVCPLPAGEACADATIALLTYGLPGFAVDPTGALHVSLMRSCTGWPSGVWIDPPKRTAPDGSGFGLQHWTHEFAYALVAGEGDWRALDLPARGQEYSTPLLARVVDPIGGDLPATHSALRVEPARRVLLGALKPAGNPVAAGSDAGTDPVRGVAVRLVETTGLGATATVSAAWSWRDARSADLLEQPGAGLDVDQRSFTVPLPGSTVETVVATPAQPVGDAGAGPVPAAVAGSVLGPVGEQAQPVFTRYWLHNRGPAPMGYLPLSVAVSPGLVPTGDGPVTVQVVLANQLTDSVREGVVELRAPEGWLVEPASRVYGLAPGGHLGFPVTLAPSGDAEPGLYFLAARTVDGGVSIEDVATLAHGSRDELGAILPTPGEVPPDREAVKGTTASTGRATGLDVAVTTRSVALAPGGQGVIGVRLTNRTGDQIRGEAQLVSPWGTWNWLPLLTTGFAVEAGESVDVAFPVDVPAGELAAHAWALPKVMWFGRTQYAQAVHLEVKR